MSDTTQTTGDANDDPVSALVGPGKKFETLTELAIGKLKADEFIEVLKKEKAELEARYNEAKGKQDEESRIEEVLKVLKQQAGKGSEDVKNRPEGNDTDLAATVRAIMKGETEAETRRRNRDEGLKLVQERVDGNADAVDQYLTSKAQELGTTKDLLLRMSEEAPIAFAKLIDANHKPNAQSPTTLKGNNTQALGHGGSVMEIDGHKTKAWYDAQRKEMGTFKFLNSSDLQVRLLRDAEALGSKFYSK